MRAFAITIAIMVAAAGLHADDGRASAQQPPVPPPRASANAAGGVPDRHPSNFLVGFKPSIRAAAKRVGIHAAMNVKALHSCRHIPVDVVELPAGRTLEEMIAAYRALPQVAYAEPNYRLRLLNTPNDLYFNDLWGLHKIGATNAWNITTGSTNIIVAVIDTGIDYNHEDLADNMWVNSGPAFGDIHGATWTNGTGAMSHGDPMDDHSHGTHVAGTIGAVGNNEIGVVGVNWRVRLMALKFLDASGEGWTADAVSAIEYAIDKGAHLSNNSWGGDEYNQSLKDAIDAAAASNQLFVAAAGNDNRDNDITPAYPASYDSPNIVAVASSDQNDNKSWFSNWGATSVHLAAPGHWPIWSAMPGDGYGQKQGTSMAAPHVAGVAALLLARNPGAAYADVKGWIMDSVTPLSQWENLVISGGRLNAAEALLQTTVATPEFDPDGGSFTGAVVEVTVSCATDGATIRYTTDGSEPATNDTEVASGGIVAVDVPGTLKAKAWKDGLNPSATKTADYYPEIVPTRLVFAASPSNTAAGWNLFPSPAVELRDDGDNLATNSTAEVQMRLTSGSGELLGTTNVNAVAGVATFTDLRIEVAGIKQLTALSGALTPAVSDSFEITSAAADHISLAGPVNATAGVWSANFTISVFDEYGNPAGLEEETVFSMTSSSDGAFGFAGDGVSGSNLTISGGSSGATFSYSDAAPGTQRTVTVAWSGGGSELGAAEHQFAVIGLIIGTDGSFVHYDEDPNAGKGTDFGHIPVGEAVTNIFGITNMLDSAISDISWTMNGDTNNFAVLDMPQEVEAGTVSNMIVRFAPDRSDEFACAIEIASGGALVATNYLRLAGLGVDGHISLDPAELTFEATFGGADPPNRIFALGNTGDGTYDFTLDKNRDWLGMAPAAGTLASGGATNIVVSAGVSGLDAGVDTAAITVHAPLAVNSPQTVDVVFVVSKAQQEITDFTPNSGTSFMADDSANLIAQAASGLAVSFERVSGPGRVIGETLSFTGEGTVKVAAFQAGDQNWEPADSVTNTYHVSKAEATVTLHNLDQMYDGSPRIVSATTDPPGLAVVITYDGESEAPINTGNYAVIGAVNDAIYHGAAAGILRVWKPDAPINVTASGNRPDAIYVNWDAASGAAAYQVWRNTANNVSTAQKLSYVTGIEYADRTAIPGVHYHYWVRSLNDEAASDFSEPASGRRAGTSGDYNGDGAADLAVYNESAGLWYIISLDESFLLWGEQWGGPGLVPVSGDFSGDGISDLAVYHEETGQWFIVSLDGSFLVWGAQWGGPGLVPVSGDFSGDGISDLAAYNEETGQWFIVSLDGSFMWGAQWGGPGLVPVSGDFSGDGISDLAVYHEETGQWFIVSLDGSFLVWGAQWGGPGLVPVPSPKSEFP